jgi:hypothetical protein
VIRRNSYIRRRAQRRIASRLVQRALEGDHAVQATWEEIEIYTYVIAWWR